MGTCVPFELKTVMATRTEALWRLYFEDPSQWWDNRIKKISPGSPDFKHKVTKDSLWLDGCTSAWVEEELRTRGLQESPFKIVEILKAYTTRKDLGKGSELHDYIQKHKFLETNPYIGTALVNMYAKCGALSKAQQVLQELPVRNVITWNALIAGHAQLGQGKEALKCFDDMLLDGQFPDAVTFTCVLNACGDIKAAAKGEEIHDKIITLGILEKDIVLGNTLVDMYAKCGALAKAHRVLEELPVRDMVTWSALIAGYVQQEQGEEALKHFDDMVCEGHYPDAITFLFVLKACGNIGAAAKGKEIHDKIVSLGMLEKDIVLGNTLLDMYAKCGALAKAQQLLGELPLRDVVTWNVLIAGYARHNQGEESLKCFDDMSREGHFPNAITFICVLKACGNVGAAVKGKEIHDKIASLGMLQKHTVLGNTLVDMYAKCGELSMAHQVLKELYIRDVVSWNALIAGYVQQGEGEEALNSFDDMLHEGNCPDVVTFICALKACGSIGAAAKGEEIHDKIVNLDMLEKSTALGSMLVDMYVKCGMLSKAQQILEELPTWDVVTWSALIAGYAQQGKSFEAIKCFERMQLKGMKPNLVTWISMLNACSHTGLFDQAETYFWRMNTEYDIHPDLEHYCCMTDLFGRAGKFNKALAMTAEMASDACLSNWVALLGACCKWGEVEIGRLAFDRALQLDKSNTAVYLLMADIYAAAGMKEEADKIELIRMKNNV